MENLDSLNNSLEQQEARAFLRERFLRCISSLTGNECKMKTIENTELSGEYQCMDIHVQSVMLKNLSTPHSSFKTCLIRTPDIFYLRFPNIKKDGVAKRGSED